MPIIYSHGLRSVDQAQAVAYYRINMSKKKIILALVAILIVMQFFQPQSNQSNQTTNLHIEKLYDVPQRVKAVLAKSCYDCHSDHTFYPWYHRIQPVAWYMATHINEGKRELNFSNFGGYSKRKQRNKFRSMSNQVMKEEMPLSSYTFIHRNAKLSPKEKQILIAWFNRMEEKSSNVD